VSPFSRRAPSDAEPNRLARALASRRAAGAEILDLTVSNPTECGLVWPRAAIDRAFGAIDATVYRPEPFGLFATRVAVCEHLARRGLRAEPERLFLTSGTSEAYGYLMKLLCDPADRVLVPAPGYPLLDSLARMESVELERFAFRYDGRWRIDEASLRAAAATDRARALLLVHPNNPTGAFVARDDLAMARELGLPIVSDEVFADYAWRDDERRLPSLLSERSDTLTFRLDGLSKSCVLPQLKLAWTLVAGPDALVHRALARLEHIADAYLSPSIPVQLATPALLEEAPALRARVRGRCLDNLATISAACAGSALTPLPVEGGWTAVIRLPAIHDDETWSIVLLDRAGVLAHPGYLYDFDDVPHLVVSLLTDPDVLGIALARLVSLVSEESAPSS